jgi:methionyl-tRNA formyltransferase
MSISVVYFGSPEFAVPVLKSMAMDSDIDVKLVVTNEAKPFGRKKIITKTAVGSSADDLGIEILEVSSMKDEGVLEKLKSCDADYFVCVAFGHIFRSDVLEIPKKGFLNVHGSLLPKYRGPSPIHASLLSGDDKTGICVMDIDKKMDAGGVYDSLEIDIEGCDNCDSLFSKLSVASGPFFLETLKKIDSGELCAIPQDESLVSYCKMVAKGDGEISFTEESSSDILRKFKAYSSWPKIYSNGVVFRSIALSDMILAPGEISEVDETIIIGCKEGSIEVTELQLSGKNPLSAAEFLKGNSLTQIYG